MEEKNFTQQKLASSLGCEQYQISRLLQGKPFPSIDELEDIANTLGTTLEYLLGLRGTSLRDLTPEDRKLLQAYDQADSSTKAVIQRLLGMTSK